MFLKRGHAMVEFALAIPVMTFLCLAGIDVALLTVQQFYLEQRCFKVARHLGLSHFETSEQLLNLARQLVSDWPKVEPGVYIRPIATKPSSSLYRASKQAEVIEVFLKKDYEPYFPLLRMFHGVVRFPLLSRVNEARIRVLVDRME